VTKIGDFIVDFLCEFEAIFKKALTRVSGAYGELFDEKTRRSKILCQGPFKDVKPYPEIGLFSQPNGVFFPNYYNKMMLKIFFSI
jgi:hypothetical protein